MRRSVLFLLLGAICLAPHLGPVVGQGLGVAAILFGLWLGFFKGK